MAGLLGDFIKAPTPVWTPANAGVSSRPSTFTGRGDSQGRSLIVAEKPSTNDPGKTLSEVYLRNQAAAQLHPSLGHWLGLPSNDICHSFALILAQALTENNDQIVKNFLAQNGRGRELVAAGLEFFASLKIGPSKNVSCLLSRICWRSIKTVVICPGFWWPLHTDYLLIWKTLKL